MRCYVQNLYKSWKLFHPFHWTWGVGVACSGRGLRWVESLESTCDAGILWMVTVVDVPHYVRALSESSFCACALQIVHLDWATAGTEVGHHLGGFRQPAAHLPAHHLCIRKIPSIIAHGFPILLSGISPHGPRSGSGPQWAWWYLEKRKKQTLVNSTLLKIKVLHDAIEEPLCLNGSIKNLWHLNKLSVCGERRFFRL